MTTNSIQCLALATVRALWTFSHVFSPHVITCVRIVPHRTTVTTKDHSVFHFLPDGRPCDGLDEVLQQYACVAQHVQLLGPTSFAPAIRQAMRIVEESNNEYHILIIIADGQV